MNKEIITDIPKIKWKILDYEKADGKLELVDINEETTFLVVNLNEIPKGLTILEWIELLLKDGIIYREPKL